MGYLAILLLIEVFNKIAHKGILSKLQQQKWQPTISKTVFLHNPLCGVVLSYDEVHRSTTKHLYCAVSAPVLTRYVSENSERRLMLSAQDFIGI